MMLVFGQKQAYEFRIKFYLFIHRPHTLFYEDHRDHRETLTKASPKKDQVDRFSGIAGNATTHGNDKKFYKSHQILKETKRNINKLCLGKISRHKTVRIRFSVDSRFS